MHFRDQKSKVLGKRKWNQEEFYDYTTSPQYLDSTAYGVRPQALFEQFEHWPIYAQLLLTRPLNSYTVFTHRQGRHGLISRGACSKNTEALFQLN